MSSPRLRGVVPSARMAFSAAPVDADTFTIGGHTFKFPTTLLAAHSYTQIKRLASPALTLAAAIRAINGITDANVVQAITPFAKPIVGDAPDATELRIRLANARGGLPVPGVAPSMVLTASITAGASAWSVGNLNATGKSPDDADVSEGTITIKAEMITALVARAELPFTPKTLTWSFEDGAGALVDSDDLVTIDGDSVKVALGGGVAPNLQVGDVVHFRALK